MLAVARQISGLIDDVGKIWQHLLKEEVKLTL
jgi:hypothetical protein